MIIRRRSMGFAPLNPSYVLIVALFFMELRRSSGQTIAFAAAGLFWLGIMFWLSLSDFLTRVPIPAHEHV